MANPQAAVSISPGIVFRPNTGIGRLTHPYVVIAVADGLALTVNWTDFEHYEESTCQLVPGDHPQVTKPSVMVYPRFKELPVAVLGVQLAKEEPCELQRLSDLRPEILQRIIDGARTSMDLTDSVKRRYRL